MASGINTTFRQVGIATGIAGLGAIFQHEITRKTTALRSSPATQADRCSAPRTASSADAARVRRSLPARAHALRPQPAPRSVTPTASASPTPSPRSLLIAAAIALVGALLAFVLVRSRDFVTAAGGEGAPERAPAEVAAGLSARALTALAAAARSPDRRAPAGAGSADRPDPSASAGTGRTPSRGCWAPAAGGHTVAQPSTALMATGQARSARRRPERSLGAAAAPPLPRVAARAIIVAYTTMTDLPATAWIPQPLQARAVDLLGAGEPRDGEDGRDARRSRAGRGSDQQGASHPAPRAAAAHERHVLLCWRWRSWRSCWRAGASCRRRMIAGRVSLGVEYDLRELHVRAAAAARARLLRPPADRPADVARDRRPAGRALLPRLRPRVHPAVGAHDRARRRGDDRHQPGARADRAGAGAVRRRRSPTATAAAPGPRSRRPSSGSAN